MEGEYWAWRGVCWCGLESYPVCATDQSSDGSHIGKVVALPFASGNTVLSKGHHLPVLHLCFKPSFHVDSCAWWLLVTVGPKSTCARVCLASLHGFRSVSCIVWLGRLEPEDTDYCYWQTWWESKLTVDNYWFLPLPCVGLGLKEMWKR